MKDTGLILKEPCRHTEHFTKCSFSCLVKMFFDKSKSNLVNRD